ncbi:hypothetical protein B7P43_G01171 [Cryptotermes secundus]|uniref:Uncharacterized protein n=1 Tax=Cryptotermes secundus TaxID=105785 RepID=A0A2J7QZW2_9NEOP|nr:hypothetical protein B7P43_G01171 [Cryptotermes secundus]
METDPFSEVLFSRIPADEKVQKPSNSEKMPCVSSEISGMTVLGSVVLKTEPRSYLMMH